MNSKSLRLSGVNTKQSIASPQLRPSPLTHFYNLQSPKNHISRSSVSISKPLIPNTDDPANHKTQRCSHKEARNPL